MAVQSLKYSAQWENADFDTPTLIPNHTPEERECAREAIKELNRLGDELLKAWDESGTSDVRAYNQQLTQVLESRQWKLYRLLLCDDQRTRSDLLSRYTTYQQCVLIVLIRFVHIYPTI